MGQSSKSVLWFLKKHFGNLTWPREIPPLLYYLRWPPKWGSNIMITFWHPTLKNWRKQNSMTTSLYLGKKTCGRVWSIPKSQSEDRRNDDHPLELPCSNIWYLTPYVEMLPLEPAIGVPDRHWIVTENGRGIRSGPMEYGWTTSVWWETSWSPVYLVVYSS